MTWNAHVWVKCSNDFKMNGNWDWAKNWENVKRVWSTMGEWDLCLEVDVKSPDELEDFVWNKLKKSTWITTTHSTWTREVWAR